jgi:hypothetical protein
MSVSRIGASDTTELYAALMEIVALSGPEKKARGQRMRRINKAGNKIITILTKRGMRKDAE